LAELAVERRASAMAVKMAGLLMTAGNPHDEALKSAQMLERHPHARKVMAMAGVYSELRDLIQSGRFHTGAATLLKVMAGRAGSLAQSDVRAASTGL
jgi:hypothetical protein